MFTKNAGSISAAAALALTLTACSGGGSGGATFHVTACSLGCSGGQSGSQVNCGVVGIAENQEIALLFTSPVDPFSITKESFAVRDAVTGDYAPGTRFVDPANPSRLIFRPKLTVGDGGEPIFGFVAGRSYVVYLNGTVQNDPQPYVESTGGRDNEARVACTVQASQGVVDAIPGKPSARVFVTVVDLPSGDSSQVEVVLGQVPGASDVKTFSSILLEFDELMDISSMLDPSTGIAPGISVQLDVDGDVSTTGDRAEIEGSYVFGLDQSAQTTSLEFTPTDGFPSLGADESQPRLVVLTLDDGITDIADNGIESPGSYNFIPQQVLFAPATLPAGGEQFADQDNLDAPLSGSPWGSEIAGRLTPGQGGGSGRHGELQIAAGETLVLHTSAGKASAEVDFTALPENNAEITLGDATFVFKTSPVDPVDVAIRYNVPYTVSTLVDVVRAYATANPSSQMATATYVQSESTVLRVEAIGAGIPSPAFPVDPQPPIGGQPFADASSGILSGGFEAHTFSDPEIVTNFDFDAGTGTPGGTPPDLSVDDGVFEFSRLTIEPTGTLVLAGTNPARLLVRGDFELADLALIDLSGEDRTEHDSATPFGQPGGSAGPNAGIGGKGGDRSDQPALADINGSAVTMASAFTNGTSGIGVGGVAGIGQGLGGLRHPLSFPVTPSTYNGWAHNVDCKSSMMANTGSGGAYAKDGLRGLTNVFDAIGTTETGTISNKPAIGNTLGGEADDVGLEAPSANPTDDRLLSPALGYLRGGSGGGGGGSHVGGTQSDVFFSGQCFTNPLFSFPDNSAAGGGGGGGAVQIQAGGSLTLTGQIDASGGDGGGSDFSGGALGILAAPGGGASGGAVLLQGGTVDLAQQPSRIQIQGGDGGQGGYALALSSGGDGSPGVLRVEQALPGGALDAVDVALSTFPTDILDPTSVEWLSSGEWIHDVAKTDAFESVTGSQSCWMQAPGPHYSLTFEDDPAAPALPADMGWNMDVILDLGAGEITVPWRGSDGNGPFLGLYPEEHWGTLLNRDLGVGESAAPLVVRFQGAATHDTIDTPCDVDVNDPNGPFQVGSQSAWVRHPRELNAFLPLPSAARFLILFDRSHADFDMIKGVTNLRIETQPE